MNCPKCNHENPGGAKFCSNCATQLCQVCPSCNETNIPADAKFCPNCGSVITQVQNMQPTYLFGPTGKWDEHREALLIDIDLVKITDIGYDEIEAELSFKPDRYIADYIAFLADDGKFELHFSCGKLTDILYFHNPEERDKLYLSLTPYEHIITHWFKSDVYTGKWCVSIDFCQDEDGDYIDAEEWFEKYRKIFYSDLDPYRKKLIDFFGFDLFKEGFWLES